MPPQENENAGKDNLLPREEAPPQNLSSEIPPIAPAPAPSPERTVPSLSPIRTYKSDTTEALKEKKGTVSSIFTAERARRELRMGDGEGEPPEYFFLGFKTKSGAFLALFASLALSFGIGSVSFVLLWRKAEPEITPSAQALVFVNKEIKIDIGDLARRELEGKVKEALGTKGLLLNDIMAITFVRKEIDAESGKAAEKVAGIDEVLALLAERVPPQLVRALGTDYLYGVHALGDNIPFLIAKVRSYENAFAGVLEWAQMITHDLAALFNITRFPLPSIYEYTDILIKNRDVGVLYDEERVPILYYSFVDRETVIFTTDRATFEELLNRLATPKRTVR